MHLSPFSFALFVISNSLFTQVDDGCIYYGGVGLEQRQRQRKILAFMVEAAEISLRCLRRPACMRTLDISFLCPAEHVHGINI